MEDVKWKYFILNSLDYAFQPIVNIHTGVCFGYEALLRNQEKTGFESIQDLFDSAFEHRMLFRVDTWLKEKAVRKFSVIKDHGRMKLFFNLDNRVLSMADYSLESTSRILGEHGLHPDSLCFEISEKHEFISFAEKNSLFDHYKRQAYKVAIDDFGTGFSGLQLLYHAEPDFIKIDRFFIAGIEADSKKKLFVSNVVNLAHILGIAVIAEGVESESEYYACKEIGCDLVQGYLIQRPTTEVADLRGEYEEVLVLNAKDARGKAPDKRLIEERLDRIDPISLYNRETGAFTDMSRVFESFRKNKSHTLFPVVNNHDEPIGLVREEEMKEYVYSKYGKDLLMNHSFGKSLKDFVVRCPRTEINTKIEKMLEAYSTEDSSSGIIVTENGKYVGFLSSRSLLTALNEKNLQVARDQNPLTKLPGNNLINEYIDRALVEGGSCHVFAYFDFDNFKAFNDKYGFRRGDRAIILFADILKEASSTQRFFVGHIGGDDFFAGFKAEALDVPAVQETVGYIVRKFQKDAMTLYDQEDRINGYIATTDRDGKERTFPLMSVSAVALYLPGGEQIVSLEEIGGFLARLKKEAKGSVEKVAFASLYEGGISQEGLARPPLEHIA